MSQEININTVALQEPRTQNQESIKAVNGHLEKFVLAKNYKEKRRVRRVNAHRNVLVIHGLFILEAFFL